MMAHRFLVGAGLVLSLAACSTTTSQRTSDRGADAVSQPFRDLAIIRSPVPPALATASAAPYAAERPGDCAALTTEITALTDVLGPDLDILPEKGPGFAEDTAVAALRSLFDLPFRGVIRKVSGAERMDRERARAVLSGMVRRGYLKGLAGTAGCTLPPAPVATGG